MEPIKDILKKALPKDLKEVSVVPSPEYKCSICKDMAMVYPAEDGKVDYSRLVPCRCSIDRLEKEKRDRLMRYCHFPAGTEHQTFDSFDTKGNPSLSAACSLALELSQGVDSVRWLTLMGKWDRGKTHLAVAICRRWLERGIPARYGYTDALLQELKDGFDLEGEGSYRMALRRLCEVPLLVLDDLGTGKSTEWTREALQLIIDHRYIHQLPLVITTNRPLTEIVNDRDNSESSSICSGRIASRLQRETWCKVVVINAPEHRIK